MKPELREKIIAYNKDKAKKIEMAADLEEIMERMHKGFALIEPLLPAEVKALFEKYGYTE